MPDKHSLAVEIVQITDMHLGADESSLLKGINTADTLTKVLAAIGQTSRDYLIATGDISEDFSAASYHLFLKLLRQNHIAPLVCLGGNHDDLTVMQPILQPVALPRVFCQGSWLFVCLNTTLPGKDEGEIVEEDLVMLEELLTGHSASHVVLFMHHHIVPVKSSWIDRYTLRNVDSLMALLARHDKVRAVISGHVHQASEASHNNVLFYTSPATSLQFVPCSDQAKVEAASPAWRKWFFWPDGSISNQIFFL